MVVVPLLTHAKGGEVQDAAGPQPPINNNLSSAKKEPRRRRGLRRLTIDVSADDLRAIAKRGYEGAVTSDLDQQAQAVGLFLNDALLQI